jgi:hypothetical protein
MKGGMKMSCDCDCGCDCGGFQRQVFTKKERLEWLEEYREDLKKELAAVEEEMSLLKRK